MNDESEQVAKNTLYYPRTVHVVHEQGIIF